MSHHEEERILAAIARTIGKATDEAQRQPQYEQARKAGNEIEAAARRIAKRIIEMGEDASAEAILPWIPF